MSKIRFTPFLPVQTMKKIDTKNEINEQHVRITRSMLYHPSFQKLSGNAIRIYMSMQRMFYKEMKSNEDFEYSKSLGVKHLGLSENSEKSVKRALKQLVDCGFIEYTYISKGGGKKNKIPNRYKFSENWKSRIYE